MTAFLQRFRNRSAAVLAGLLAVLLAGLVVVAEEVSAASENTDANVVQTTSAPMSSADGNGSDQASYGDDEYADSEADTNETDSASYADDGAAGGFSLNSISVTSLVSPMTGYAIGYAQDGLIAHWDAIDNQATGSHLAGASTWVDLVAGRKFKLNGATFDARSLSFNGSSSYATLSTNDTEATFWSAQNGTVEIVLSDNGARNADVMVFQTALKSGQNYSPSLGFYNSKQTWILQTSLGSSYTGGQIAVAKIPSAVTNTVVLMYTGGKVGINASSDVYVNAGSVQTTSEGEFWSTGTVKYGATVLGIRTKGGSPFKGKICAIRIYNRRLTADEIATNAALDQARFVRGEPVTVGSAKIILTGYAKTTALQGFPVLVRLSATRFPGINLSKYFKADGSDVRFYDSDGNEIPHEIEQWNPSGESLIWVRVPTLVGNGTAGTTYITMKWGATAARTKKDAQVWNSSYSSGTSAKTVGEYAGVWHMNELGNQTDRSGHGYNLTSSGTTTQDSLWVGDGVRLGDGTTSTLGKLYAEDFLLDRVPSTHYNTVYTTPTEFSFSAWFSLSDAQRVANTAFMNCGKWINSREFGFNMKLQKSNANQLQLLLSTYSPTVATSGSITPNPATYPPTGERYYMTYTYSSGLSSKRSKLYVNGVEAGTYDKLLYCTNTISSSTFFLGGDKNCSGAKFDEVRIRRSSVSADWAKADYDTQNPGTTFFTVDNVQNPTAIPVAKPKLTASSGTYSGSAQKSKVSPSSSATGVTYAWTGDWTNAGKHSVKATLSDGYCWDDKTTAPITLTYTINQADNSWTTEPKLSKTEWKVGEEPAIVTSGAAKSKTSVVVTYDDAGATDMPTSVGGHTAHFNVAASDNYKALSKDIAFTIKNADPTPGGITTNAMSNASWGYIIGGLGSGNEVAYVYTNTIDKAMTFTVPANVDKIDFLAVGGGGAGGGKQKGAQYAGGGGGAGGMVYRANQQVAAGQTLKIAVGKGGSANATVCGVEQNGSASALTNLDDVASLQVTAEGGGAGGYKKIDPSGNSEAGRSGASGGGGAHMSAGGDGIPGRGNSGGKGDREKDVNPAQSYIYYGGGGGGAGVKGGDGNVSALASLAAGSGGDGLPCSITGTEVYYAGGGGGGTGMADSYSYPAGAGGKGGGGHGSSAHSTSGYGGVPAAGTDGLGGGGGGAGDGQATSARAGGKGGSGVVIIRYAVSEVKYPVVTDDDGKPIGNWGYVVPNLGAARDETALVFTNTAYATDHPMKCTLPNGVEEIWYLVVGGGGSGGSSYANGNGGGGGGGAGGFVEKADCKVGSAAVSVSIGAGGAAVTATGNNDSSRPSGKNGFDSVLTIGSLVVTAHGGGGGGGGNRAGNEGGSGGGGGATTAGVGGVCYDDDEGNAGGDGKGINGTQRGGGGGGGAGAAGSSATSTAGAKGGNGKVSAIGGGYVSLYKDKDGNEYYCAGGGGGSAGTSDGGAGGVGGGGKGNVYNASAATVSDSGANYGCGGGGTQGNQWKNHTSGAGYQGVVVVRYRVPVTPTADKFYWGKQSGSAHWSGYRITYEDGRTFWYGNEARTDELRTYPDSTDADVYVGFAGSTVKQKISLKKWNGKAPVTTNVNWVSAEFKLGRLTMEGGSVSIGESGGDLVFPADSATSRIVENNSGTLAFEFMYLKGKGEIHSAPYPAATTEFRTAILKGEGSDIGYVPDTTAIAPNAKVVVGPRLHDNGKIEDNRNPSVLSYLSSGKADTTLNLVITNACIHLTSMNKPSGGDGRLAIDLQLGNLNERRANVWDKQDHTTVMLDVDGTLDIEPGSTLDIDATHLVKSKTAIVGSYDLLRYGTADTDNLQVGKLKLPLNGGTITIDRPLTEMTNLVGGVFNDNFNTYELLLVDNLLTLRIDYRTYYDAYKTGLDGNPQWGTNNWYYGVERNKPGQQIPIPPMCPDSYLVEAHVGKDGNTVIHVVEDHGGEIPPPKTVYRLRRLTMDGGTVDCRFGTFLFPPDKWLFSPETDVPIVEVNKGTLTFMCMNISGQRDIRLAKDTTFYCRWMRLRNDGSVVGVTNTLAAGESATIGFAPEGEEETEKRLDYSRFSYLKSGVKESTLNVLIHDARVELTSTAVPSGGDGKLAFDIMLGPANLPLGTTNCPMQVAGTLEIASNSTLKVDATRLTKPGKYPLIVAGTLVGEHSIKAMTAKATVTCAPGREAVVCREGNTIWLNILAPVCVYDFTQANPLRSVLGTDAFSATNGNNGTAGSYRVPGLGINVTTGNDGLYVPRSSHLGIPVPRTELTGRNFKWVMRFFCPKDSHDKYRSIFTWRTANEDDSQMYVREKKSSTDDSRTSNCMGGKVTSPRLMNCQNADYQLHDWYKLDAPVSANTWYTITLSQTETTSTLTLDGNVYLHSENGWSGSYTESDPGEPYPGKKLSTDFFGGFADRYDNTDGVLRLFADDSGEDYPLYISHFAVYGIEGEAVPVDVQRTATTAGGAQNWSTVATANYQNEVIFAPDAAQTWTGTSSASKLLRVRFKGGAATFNGLNLDYKAKINREIWTLENGSHVTLNNTTFTYDTADSETGFGYLDVCGNSSLTITGTFDGSRRTGIRFPEIGSGAGSVAFVDTTATSLAELIDGASDTTQTLALTNACAYFTATAATSGVAGALLVDIKLGNNNQADVTTPEKAALAFAGTLKFSAAANSLTLDASTKGVGTYRILDAKTVVNPGGLTVKTVKLPGGNVGINKALTALPATGVSGNYHYELRWEGNVLTLTLRQAKYKIKFDANGGEGGGCSASEYTYATTDQSVTLTQPTFVGHTFRDWTVSGGTTLLNGNNLTIKARSMGDIAVMAKWTTNTYAISYVLVGGTHGTSQPTNATFGTAFCVSAPKKTNFLFTGWKVTSGLDASTAKYGTSGSQTTDITSSDMKCTNGATEDVYFLNLTPTNNVKVTLTATWDVAPPPPVTPGTNWWWKTDNSGFWDDVTDCNWLDREPGEYPTQDVDAVHFNATNTAVWNPTKAITATVRGDYKVRSLEFFESWRLDAGKSQYDVTLDLGGHTLTGVRHRAWENDMSSLSPEAEYLQGDCLRIVSATNTGENAAYTVTLANGDFSFATLEMQGFRTGLTLSNATLRLSGKKCVIPTSPYGNFSDSCAAMRLAPMTNDVPGDLKRSDIAYGSIYVGPGSQLLVTNAEHNAHLAFCAGGAGQWDSLLQHLAVTVDGGTFLLGGHASFHDQGFHTLAVKGGGTFCGSNYEIVGEGDASTHYLGLKCDITVSDNSSFSLDKLTVMRGGGAVVAFYNSTWLKGDIDVKGSGTTFKFVDAGLPRPTDEWNFDLRGVDNRVYFSLDDNTVATPGVQYHFLSTIAGSNNVVVFSTRTRTVNQSRGVYIGTESALDTHVRLEKGAVVTNESAFVFGTWADCKYTDLEFGEDTRWVQRGAFSSGYGTGVENPVADTAALKFALPNQGFAVAPLLVDTDDVAFLGTTRIAVDATQYNCSRFDTRRVPLITFARRAPWTDSNREELERRLNRWAELPSIRYAAAPRIVLDGNTVWYQNDGPSDFWWVTSASEKWAAATNWWCGALTGLVWPNSTNAIVHVAQGCHGFSKSLTTRTQLVMPKLISSDDPTTVGTLYVDGTNKTDGAAQKIGMAFDKVRLWQTEITFPGYANLIKSSGWPAGTALTNYPVLVRFDPGKTAALKDFYDNIRRERLSFWYGEGDDMASLPYDIDEWRGSNDVSYVWVRIPELKADTKITVRWDNDVTGYVDSRSAEVWEDHAFVLHLDSVETAWAKNSTKYGNDLAGNNGEPNDNGVLGGIVGQGWRGGWLGVQNLNGYFNWPTSGTAWRTFTYSVWYRNNVADFPTTKVAPGDCRDVAWFGNLHEAGGDLGTGWKLMWDWGGKYPAGKNLIFDSHYYDESKGHDDKKLSKALAGYTRTDAPKDWHLLTLVCEPDPTYENGSKFTAYVNGKASDKIGFVNFTPYPPVAYCAPSDFPHYRVIADEAMDADEIRYSMRVRSPHEIEADYYQVKNQSSFCAFTQIEYVEPPEMEKFNRLQGETLVVRDSDLLLDSGAFAFGNMTMQTTRTAAALTNVVTVLSSNATLQIAGDLGGAFTGGNTNVLNTLRVLDGGNLEFGRYSHSLTNGQIEAVRATATQTGAGKTNVISGVASRWSFVDSKTEFRGPVHPSIQFGYGDTKTVLYATGGTIRCHFDFPAKVADTGDPSQGNEVVFCDTKLTGSLGNLVGIRNKVTFKHLSATLTKPDFPGFETMRIGGYDCAFEINRSQIVVDGGIDVRIDGGNSSSTNAPTIRFYGSNAQLWVKGKFDSGKQDDTRDKAAPRLRYYITEGPYAAAPLVIDDANCNFRADTFFHIKMDESTIPSSVTRIPLVKFVRDMAIDSAKLGLQMEDATGAWGLDYDSKTFEIYLRRNGGGSSAPIYVVHQKQLDAILGEPASEYEPPFFPTIPAAVAHAEASRFSNHTVYIGLDQGIDGQREFAGAVVDGSTWTNAPSSAAGTLWGTNVVLRKSYEFVGGYIGSKYPKEDDCKRFDPGNPSRYETVISNYTFCLPGVETQRRNYAFRNLRFTGRSVIAPVNDGSWGASSKFFPEYDIGHVVLDSCSCSIANDSMNTLPSNSAARFGALYADNVFLAVRQSNERQMDALVITNSFVELLGGADGGRKGRICAGRWYVDELTFADSAFGSAANPYRGHVFVTEALPPEARVTVRGCTFHSYAIPGDTSGSILFLCQSGTSTNVTIAVSNNVLTAYRADRTRQDILELHSDSLTDTVTPGAIVYTRYKSTNDCVALGFKYFVGHNYLNGYCYNRISFSTLVGNAGTLQDLSGLQCGHDGQGNIQPVPFGSKLYDMYAGKSYDPIVHPGGVTNDIGAAHCCTNCDSFVRFNRARQRYPWNNKADYDYEVGGRCEYGTNLSVTVSVRTNETQLASHTYPAAPGLAAPGTHRLTWDLADEVGPHYCPSNVTFQLDFNYRKNNAPLLLGRASQEGFLDTRVTDNQTQVRVLYPAEAAYAFNLLTNFTYSGTAWGWPTNAADKATVAYQEMTGGTVGVTNAWGTADRFGDWTGGAAGNLITGADGEDYVPWPYARQTAVYKFTHTANGTNETAWFKVIMPDAYAYWILHVLKDRGYKWNGKQCVWSDEFKPPFFKTVSNAVQYAEQGHFTNYVVYVHEGVHEGKTVKRKDSSGNAAGTWGWDLVLTKNMQFIGCQGHDSMPCGNLGCEVFVHDQQPTPCPHYTEPRDKNDESSYHCVVSNYFFALNGEGCDYAFEGLKFMGRSVVAPCNDGSFSASSAMSNVTDKAIGNVRVGGCCVRVDHGDLTENNVWHRFGSLYASNIFLARRNGSDRQITDLTVTNNAVIMSGRFAAGRWYANHLLVSNNVMGTMDVPLDNAAWVTEHIPSNAVWTLADNRVVSKEYRVMLYGRYRIPSCGAKVRIENNTITRYPTGEDLYQLMMTNCVGYFPAQEKVDASGDTVYISRHNHVNGYCFNRLKFDDQNPTHHPLVPFSADTNHVQVGHDGGYRGNLQPLGGATPLADPYGHLSYDTSEGVDHRTEPGGKPYDLHAHGEYCTNCESHVTFTQARQRYPWNGKVDYDYAFGGRGHYATNAVRVTPSVTTNGAVRMATPELVASDPAALGARGGHRVSWDLGSESFGKYYYVTNGQHVANLTFGLSFGYVNGTVSEPLGDVAWTSPDAFLDTRVTGPDEARVLQPEEAAYAFGRLWDFSYSGTAWHWPTNDGTKKATVDYVQMKGGDWQFDRKWGTATWSGALRTASATNVLVNAAAGEGAKPWNDPVHKNLVYKFTHTANGTNETAWFRILIDYDVTYVVHTNQLVTLLGANAEYEPPFFQTIPAAVAYAEDGPFTNCTVYVGLDQRVDGQREFAGIQVRGEDVPEWGRDPGRPKDTLWGTNVVLQKSYDFIGGYIRGFKGGDPSVPEVTTYDHNDESSYETVISNYTFCMPGVKDDLRNYRFKNLKFMGHTILAIHNDGTWHGSLNSSNEHDLGSVEVINCFAAPDNRNGSTGSWQGRFGETSRDNALIFARQQNKCQVSRFRMIDTAFEKRVPKTSVFGDCAHYFVFSEFAGNLVGGGKGIPLSGALFNTKGDNIKQTLIVTNNIMHMVSVKPSDAAGSAALLVSSNSGSISNLTVIAHGNQTFNYGVTNHAPLRLAKLMSLPSSLFGFAVNAQRSVQEVKLDVSHNYLNGYCFNDVVFCEGKTPFSIVGKAGHDLVGWQHGHDWQGNVQDCAAGRKMHDIYGGVAYDPTVSTLFTNRIDESHWCTNCDTLLRFVSARQRYPWNGKVDADYEIKGRGISADADVGTAEDVTLRVDMSVSTGAVHVAGATVPNLAVPVEPMTGGVYRVTWDLAREDNGKMYAPVGVTNYLKVAYNYKTSGVSADVSRTFDCATAFLDTRLADGKDGVRVIKPGDYYATVFPLQYSGNSWQLPIGGTATVTRQRMANAYDWRGDGNGIGRYGDMREEAFETEEPGPTQIHTGSGEGEVEWTDGHTGLVRLVHKPPEGAPLVAYFQFPEPSPAEWLYAQKVGSGGVMRVIESGSNFVDIVHIFTNTAEAAEFRGPVPLDLTGGKPSVTCRYLVVGGGRGGTADSYGDAGVAIGDTSARMRRFDLPGNFNDRSVASVRAGAGGTATQAGGESYFDCTTANICKRAPGGKNAKGAGGDGVTSAIEDGSRTNSYAVGESKLSHDGPGSGGVIGTASGRPGIVVIRYTLKLRYLTPSEHHDVEFGNTNCYPLVASALDALTAQDPEGDAAVKDVHCWYTGNRRDENDLTATPAQEDLADHTDSWITVGTYEYQATRTDEYGTRWAGCPREVMSTNCLVLTIRKATNGWSSLPGVKVGGKTLTLDDLTKLGSSEYAWYADDTVSEVRGLARYCKTMTGDTRAVGIAKRADPYFQKNGEPTFSVTSDWQYALHPGSLKEAGPKTLTFRVADTWNYYGISTSVTVRVGSRAQYDPPRGRWEYANLDYADGLSFGGEGVITNWIDASPWVTVNVYRAGCQLRYGDYGSVWADDKSKTNRVCLFEVVKATNWWSKAPAINGGSHVLPRGVAPTIFGGEARTCERSGYAIPELTPNSDTQAFRAKGEPSCNYTPAMIKALAPGEWHTAVFSVADTWNYCGLTNYYTFCVQNADPPVWPRRKNKWEYEQRVVQVGVVSAADKGAYDTFWQQTTKAVQYRLTDWEAPDTITDGNRKLTVSVTNEANNFSIDYDDPIKRPYGTWPWENALGGGAWLCRPSASEEASDTPPAVEALLGGDGLFLRVAKWQVRDLTDFARPSGAALTNAVTMRVPAEFHGHTIAPAGEKFWLLVGTGVSTATDDDEPAAEYPVDVYPSDNWQVKTVKAVPSSVTACIAIDGVVYGDGDECPVRFPAGCTATNLTIKAVDASSDDVKVQWTFGNADPLPGDKIAEGTQVTTAMRLAMPEPTNRTVRICLTVRKTKTAQTTKMSLKATSDGDLTDSAYVVLSLSQGQPGTRTDPDPVPVPKSDDPNEMEGPGSRDDDVRLLMPGTNVYYTIHFENKPEAEAAAQSVKITNELSPLFDWSTFRADAVGFGADGLDLSLRGLQNGKSKEDIRAGTNYAVRTELTFDDKTGVASWLLRIVMDAPYGDSEGWPQGAWSMTGFLPPNDEDHAGEGYVRYSVKVRDDAPRGAVITNSATIVFDNNEPIVTDPAWWNTIDGRAKLLSDVLTTATLEKVREKIKAELEAHPEIESVRILGNERIVQLTLDLGISPKLTFDGTAGVAEYAEPKVSIVSYEQASPEKSDYGGRLRVRVEPGDGNTIATVPVAGAIRVYGRKSLANGEDELRWTFGEFDDYLKPDTRGEAVLKPWAPGYRFFRIHLMPAKE